MEKYSQFRDKGTAIAPFLPVPSPPTGALWTAVHTTLYVFRAPAVLFLSIFYFFFLELIPVGSLAKRCVLWLLLAIPGVWWVDLQVDGVKRGYVNRLNADGSSRTPDLSKSFDRQLASAQEHLPHPNTIIASSFTSPLDPLYLAGIFQPVFTRSFPNTRKVERITLFRAILLAFAQPESVPSNPDNLITLKELQKREPGSIICVFPECTTTNGRGILPFSPSLLTVDPKTKIYPVSLRYTPGDITTPVPGGVFTWTWKLLSKPTHSLRVRIARHMYNNPSLDSSNYGATAVASSVNMGFDTNIFDSPRFRNGGQDDDADDEDDSGEEEVTGDEQKVLDRVGEDLARLGRVKRVALGVEEKIEFVKVWTKRKR